MGAVWECGHYPGKNKILQSWFYLFTSFRPPKDTDTPVTGQAQMHRTLLKYIRDTANEKRCLKTCMNRTSTFK